MITRKLGKLLRGNATPFQLFSACILGSMLGFMPGMTQASGLIVVLTFALLVLNANIGLALLFFGITKLASLALMPVSFKAGQFLLDGPTRGLFQGFINAPVLALFGFEYYATTGGLLIGTVVGIIAGFAVVKAITGFRKKMVSLEETSEAFKKFTSTGWAKFGTWLFLGSGVKKDSYADLLNKKMGLPVRPMGIVLVLLLAVAGWGAVQMGKGPIMTKALKDGLAQANGATVDLENAEFDFKENRLTITGLAIADATALDTDILRAAKLEADVGAADLLRKRLRLDRLVISDASHGEKRSTPGKHIGNPPKISEPPPAKEGDAKTMDDYLSQAKEWKAKLAKLKEWMEKLSGPKKEGEGAEAPKGETLEERLRRQVEQLGYANVRADHLLTKSPLFIIGELLAEKVRVVQLPDETLDIKARNLSTHPWLVAEDKDIVITSSKDSVGARILLGGSTTNTAGNAFDFHYRGLATDAVASGIKFGGKTPISGGTMDIFAKGTWKNEGGMVVDLPLAVTLKNAKITVPGGGETTLESLNIPIGIEGPLDNPRIKVESKAFANVLAQAGMQKAKDLIKDKAGAEIEKALGGKLPGGAKSLLDGFLGGKKK